MIKVFKENYRGFRGWIRYIRDYKDNINNESIMEGTIVELNKKIAITEDKYKIKISELECEIEEKAYLNKEKENLLAKRNKRIEILNKDYSDVKKRNTELREIVNNLSKKVELLTAELIEKEKQRRKSAGSIGGLTTRVNELIKALEQANYTIDFYKKNRKKPTLEELKAYEYSRKEVERRQKTIQTKNITITCGKLNASSATTAKSEVNSNGIMD